MVQQLIKKKKKKWYPILATKEFNGIEIGETTVSEPEQALNKIIAVSLANLTNDIKKQNTLILFKTVSIKDDKVHTEIIGYSTLPSFIKRQVRSSKSRLEESYLCRTKDNILIRIKPLVPIKHEPNKSILTALRKKLRESIIRTIGSQTYLEMIGSVMNYKILKDLQTELKKIYPVSNIVIKSLKKENLEKRVKKKEEKIEEKVEEAKPEEAQEETQEITETVEEAKQE